MVNTEQPESRLKQYYVLRSHQESDLGKWDEGEIIEIDPDVAIPYVGARILVPLASAIRTQIIPPLDPKLAQQIETEFHPVSNFNTIVEPEKPVKKTLVKNSLKDAVQEKKTAEVEEEAVLIPSESEAEPPKELTAQEKAIQDKIAALKKKK